MRRTAVLLGGLCAGLLVLAGCGSGDAGSGTAISVNAPPADGRAERLQNCPANAPSWEQLAAPATARASEDPAVTRDLDRGLTTVNRYLATLPADQAGDLRVDQDAGSVVVQVTRGAPEVQKTLQAQVGPGLGIRVETVRYSKATLEKAARQIEAIQGLEWSSVGHGGNGRVEVGVPGDVGAARALIAKSVDPCMFAVSQEERPGVGTG